MRSCIHEGRRQSEVREQSRSTGTFAKFDLVRRKCARTSLVLPYFVAAPVLLLTGCSAPSDKKPLAEYNKETGRLERLIGDRNGDGKPDTWAYMDGTYTSRIELDRNGDGVAERTEFYVRNTAPGATTPSVIDRVEERERPDGPIVRREFYRDGVMERVDEDTNGDGRPDKWEHYSAGTLTRVDLDTLGNGFPDRRLTYGADGTVRVESDPDGNGVFDPLPAGK